MFEAVGYQVEVDGRTMFLVEEPTLLDGGGRGVLVLADAARTPAQAGPRRVVLVRLGSQEEALALALGGPAPT